MKMYFELANEPENNQEPVGIIEKVIEKPHIEEIETPQTLEQLLGYVDLNKEVEAEIELELYNKLVRKLSKPVFKKVVIDRDAVPLPMDIDFVGKCVRSLQERF